MPPSSRRSPTRPCASRFADLGQNIPAARAADARGANAYHKSEIDKWWPLIRAAGIKAECIVVPAAEPGVRSS